MATPKLLNVSLAEKLDFYSTPEPNSGCQLWLACTNRCGYGRIGHAGKTHLAHRASYEISIGHPIPRGMFVLHKCDVPACINPAHLKLGTQADNIRDMVLKGRTSGKLTATDVIEIRASSLSQKELAGDYNVDRTLIGLILSRKIWRYV